MTKRIKKIRKLKRSKASASRLKPIQGRHSRGRLRLARHPLAIKSTASSKPGRTSNVLTLVKRSRQNGGRRMASIRGKERQMRRPKKRRLAKINHIKNRRRANSKAQSSSSAFHKEFTTEKGQRDRKGYMVQAISSLEVEAAAR